MADSNGYIHCNICFSTEISEISMSQCGHFGCRKHSNGPTCPVCGIRTVYIPLSKKMPMSVRPFFQSISEQSDKLKEVMQFQLGHWASLVDGLTKRMKGLEKELEMMKSEWNNSMRMQAQQSPRGPPPSKNRMFPFATSQSSPSSRSMAPMTPNPYMMKSDADSTHQQHRLQSQTRNRTGTHQRLAPPPRSRPGFAPFLTPVPARNGWSSSNQNRSIMTRISQSRSQHAPEAGSKLESGTGLVQHSIDRKLASLNSPAPVSRPSIAVVDDAHDDDDEDLSLKRPREASNMDALAHTSAQALTSSSSSRTNIHMNSHSPLSLLSSGAKRRNVDVEIDSMSGMSDAVPVAPRTPKSLGVSISSSSSDHFDARSEAIDRFSRLNRG